MFSVELYNFNTNKTVLKEKYNIFIKKIHFGN